MQIKTSGVGLRSQASVGGGSGGSKMINVNNRNLGAVGEMSQGFKTGANTSAMREKMQLKRMMVKATHENYKDNPIMARRLNQDIAQKASGIYGMEAKKLMPKMTQTNNYLGGLNKQGGGAK